jgi:hypothetical protein
MSPLVLTARHAAKYAQSSVKTRAATGAFSGMATREGPWVELLQAYRAPAIGSVSTAMRAPNGCGHAARLAADPDSELVRVIVAAITLVDADAARLDAEELRHVGDGWASVWPPKGLPCSALACSTN